MPVPINNNPISRSSMREEVYNTLLTWIMEGELRPGEKILDKELAENMGVSRTPVREALRRLEDKGLVESSANRWTRVAQVSVKEPEMIYPIIWNLEELAIAQAMEHFMEADFKKMQDANTALGQALEEENPVKAYKADARFHDVYIQRSQNPHLINILQDLKIKSRRVEVTYFEGYTIAKHSMDEHGRILDALRTKDLDLVRSLIRSNWQNSLKRLKNIKCRTNFYESEKLTE
ncbi:MAG: GntR family transcriptional regulator [Desulfobacula sp.]|jgi:DNA-binding GntR family transcriptional regulator|nr:GntR family transcriptional regulator [Desulfobacula sp.]